MCICLSEMIQLGSTLGLLYTLSQTTLMSQCYVSHNVMDAVADIKDMNIPRRMVPELMAKIMLDSLEKTGEGTFLWL